MFRKIVTLTLNPCIDKSTSVAGLIPEKKLRCAPPVFEPGGGGINVARAIGKLGGRAMAIYPAGGYSGKFLNELLQNEQVITGVVETESHTRENLIVLDESSNNQYRFGMPGPVLLDREWKNCLDLVALQNAEYVVVSGSIPGGVPLDVVARVARIAKKQGQKLVVDTSGLPLKMALEEGVYLIKPNLSELGELLKTEATKDTAADMAGEIVRKGQCKVVVVSLGQDGALLVTEGFSRSIRPPVVRRRSTVGAGDSMVAGIVFSLSNGSPVEESVRYGVACGTAAAMNPGTQLCNLKDVEGLLTRMQEGISS